MIQRIQTIWLSVATLLSLLLLNGDFLRFTGQNQETYTVGLSGLMRVSVGATELLSKSVLLSMALILLPVTLLAAVFLFKKRSIQKLTAILAICLSVLLSIEGCYYWYIITEKYNALIAPGIKMTIPVIVLILAMLAYAGINKDTKIVKSYDRLR
jgi:glucan phosphoethanolaminetransferase (alkaline phosphatase superfamily)